MDQFNAQYHLPGLFEFYALYRLFLPLFFEHREYFYDWCGIGSIYGAPEGCLWVYFLCQYISPYGSANSDLSFCLVPKEPTKPATLLNRFCLTLRLIGSGLAGKKLLMHCPSMESLGRCRSLLCRHQRRADLRQPCVQFLDLLVLYSKLLAFPV